MNTEMSMMTAQPSSCLPSLQNESKFLNPGEYVQVRRILCL